PAQVNETFRKYIDPEKIATFKAGDLEKKSDGSSSSSTKESTTFDGTWLPATAEIAGQPFPEELRKAMKLDIKGDKYTVTVGDNVDKGSFKVDNSAKPKTMDIKGTDGPNKDQTLLAIWELDGDTMRICYDLAGKNRPSEFKTKPDTQLFLVTY